MKIQVIIATPDGGKNRLILQDVPDSIQQLAVAKFFGYCRDANAAAMLNVQQTEPK